MGRLPASPDQRTSGILIMAAGLSILPFMDAIAKILVADMPASQITFGRFVWQMLLSLLVLLALRRFAKVRVRPYWPNLLRGMLFAGASVLMFSALKVMGIAEALAIFFVQPLILALMSAALLGERVGLNRYIAIFVGFGGALMIIQPGWDAFGAYALLPLGAAFLFASYFLVTRYASGQSDPYAMQFISGLSASLLLGGGLCFGSLIGLHELTPVAVSGEAFLLLALAGAIGFVGHVVIVMAFARAQASTLAPIGYLELPIAIVIGYLIFDDLPKGAALVGIILICLSGLYIMRTERTEAAHS